MMPFLVITLVIALVGQVARPAMFAGRWEAEIGGTTFIRLDITERDGRLVGTMGVGAMRLDSRGDVESADPINATEVLGDLQIRNGVLVFNRPDGNDLDRFEMRVSGATASLSLIITPEFAQELKNDGIAQPRPVPLKKSPP